MAKENRDTPAKKKGNNSAFRRFEQLAKKIVRVPKSQAHKSENLSQTRTNK